MLKNANLRKCKENSTFQNKMGCIGRDRNSINRPFKLQRNKSLDKRKTEEGLGFPEISFRLFLTWFIGLSLVFLTILLF